MIRIMTKRVFGALLSALLLFLCLQTAAGALVITDDNITSDGDQFYMADGITVGANAKFYMSVVLTPGSTGRLQDGIVFYRDTTSQSFFRVVIRRLGAVDRADLFMEKQVNDSNKGYMIGNEYPSGNDCYVSSVNGWNAGGEKSFTLTIVVDTKTQVATVTMRGNTTSNSVTIHYDLTKAAMNEGTAALLKAGEVGISRNFATTAYSNFTVIGFDGDTEAVPVSTVSSAPATPASTPASAATTPSKATSNASSTKPAASSAAAVSSQTTASTGTSSTTVKINGELVDGSDNPIPNAVVKIDPDTVSAITDSDGIFTLNGVLTGSYTLTILNSDNQAVARGNIEVAAGDIAGVSGTTITAADGVINLRLTVLSDGTISIEQASATSSAASSAPTGGNPSAGFPVALIVVLIVVVVLAGGVTTFLVLRSKGLLPFGPKAHSKYSLAPRISSPAQSK